MKTTRMQYISQGERYTHGLNFRVYHGRNDQRYADVHPDDVSLLEASGTWEVLETPEEESTQPEYLSTEERDAFVGLVRSLTGNPVVVIASEHYDELAAIVSTVYEFPELYTADSKPEKRAINMIFLDAGQRDTEYLIDRMMDGGIVVLYNRRRPSQLSANSPLLVEIGNLTAYMLSAAIEIESPE